MPSVAVRLGTAAVKFRASVIPSVAGVLLVVAAVGMSAVAVNTATRQWLGELGEVDEENISEFIGSPIELYATFELRKEQEPSSPGSFAWSSWAPPSSERWRTASR